MRIALVVNPLAGLGGKVGLKGTDHAADEALRRGAEPTSPERALRALRHLATRVGRDRLPEPDWLTAAGAMGEQLAREAGFTRIQVVHAPGPRTDARDTQAAARAALELGAQLILFCGGDGTARDVASAVQGRVPIVGIPAGVKMHSAVFGQDPERAADMVADFLEGIAGETEAEVLDVDEEAYRRGEWRVKLFALARTLDEPMLRQLGKSTLEEVSDAEQKDEIAQEFVERMRKEPEALFLLGPGSTLEHVAKALRVPKTLLGFDALRDGKLVGQDLDERSMLDLVGPAGAPSPARAYLVVSPIGAQGFVLGRGNQQASPEVVRRIGLPNLLIVATPQKVRATPELRVDTGDPALDAELRARSHLPVVVGWRTSRLLPVL
ncbi:MAG: ATP-NAD kinase family protein [Halobacteriales archaeon]|nr:ATP-NAD kinase family protein [Halobacteriales archaeon]